jgi:plastocyanin
MMGLDATLWRFATLATPLVLIAACGGGNDDEPETSTLTPSVVQDTAPAPTAELQPQPEVPQQLDETASAPEGGTIGVEAREIRFTPNRWTVALGETISIVIANGDSVQHNMRIAGLDGQYDTEDDAVTVPAALNGGETGELIFSPLVPGEYTFRCDFHPAQMGGRIEVEPGVP